MRRLLRSIVITALCLGHATTGHAGQVSQPMNVSLTIGAPGGEVSLLVGSLVLTGVSPGPASGSTIVHVTAPADMPYTISLSIGLHQILESRGLSGLSLYPLPYALFSDQAHTQLWGYVSGPSSIGPPVSGVGTGIDQAYTVYGETGTWSGAYLAGTYTDVVTAAVDF